MSKSTSKLKDKTPWDTDPMPIKQLRKTKINGKTVKISWKLKEKGVLAKIEHPVAKDRTIYVDLAAHKDNDKEALNSLCHEYFHGARWSWPEGKVRVAADELSDLLWRAGFRLR